MSKVLRPSEGEITHRLNLECFLCGHEIVHDAQLAYFKDSSPMSPKAPCHTACLNGRPVVQVAREYHRRIADAANAPRSWVQ
jgi:hypothetical protein